MTPKQVNPLTVIEGVQSRFFLATAVAEAIRHVCQTRFECPVSKGQCVLCKPLGERELGVVQKAWTWCPIPLRANLLQRPAESLHERIRSETHHWLLIQFLLWLRKITGPLSALMGKWCGTLRFMVAFSFGVGLQARKDISHLLSPHCVPQQGLAQVSQSLNESVAFQIEHSLTPISRMLAVDWSINHWLSITPIWREIVLALVGEP